MSSPWDVVCSACPFSGLCKGPSGASRSRPGILVACFYRAAPHMGQSSPHVRIWRRTSAYERVAGPFATYMVSVPDRRALAYPGLALLSEKPNLSRLGTTLFSSVGARFLGSALSRHSSRTVTPIPSSTERGWLCVSGIYDPQLATRATIHVRASRVAFNTVSHLLIPLTLDNS